LDSPQRTPRPVYRRSGPWPGSCGRIGGCLRHLQRENERLRSTLEWSFAGKQQRGWHLYELLIGETIGTREAADTTAFAEALARWQGRNGLDATGILDKTTLEAFVKTWQGNRRLGSGTSMGMLVTAPISEFYDPTRSPDLLQLDAEAYAAYRRMIAAAAKDLKASPGEKYFSIISAYRSPAYQEELRRREPNAGRGALAKVSVHSTGRALDIYVGGEPVKTADANRAIQVNTPAYKWLVRNAAKFGFVPYFYEPWHWEYVPEAAAR
jgi:zinc D-Ala-D-Ala carboxypeptidase